MNITKATEWYIRIMERLNTTDDRFPETVVTPYVPSQDGISQVSRTDRRGTWWNYMDSDGNILSDEWFIAVTDFTNGIAHVMYNGGQTFEVNTEMAKIGVAEWPYAVSKHQQTTNK